MEMEKQELTFEEAEVVKQEEEATPLIRKARTVKIESESNINGAAVDSVVVNDGVVEHEVQPETPANGTKNEGLVLGDEEKIEETGEVLGNGTGSLNGEHKSENLVFYDKVEGANSASGYTVEDKIVKVTEHNKVNGSSFEFVAENNSASIASNGKVEDIASSSKVQPSEISVEERSTSYQTSNEIERVEDDQIIGDDLEVTDYDVEGVLQKQNTHDLYCPNCKSCITRRVILRKRKRRIRIPDEEVKRNKVEATFGDKVGAGSIHHPRDVATGDIQAPTVDDNDDDRDREPFIFKCLSCFTFFIPIGFREKTDKETVQGQQPSNIRKNWFFTSMFASKKLETTEQETISQTGVQKHGVGVSTSVNLGDHSAQPTLSQTTVHTSKGLSGTTGNNVSLIVEDNKIVPSPDNKSSSDGKGKLIGANELDSTIVETVDVTVGQLESYTSDQLYESTVSKQVHNNKENNSSGETFLKSSDVTNGVPEGHSNGRLKLLISSDEESPSVTAASTDKEVILLPTSISVHRDSDADGKLSISMAVPQEQKQDFKATIVTESIFDDKNANLKDSDSGLVYRSEASQHITTKTQFQVHSGETLKVDSISAVSNASAAQGKDTLITIDVPPSQPVQGIIAPPETLVQPSTQVIIGDRESIDQSAEESRIEIVKSIVYGGLAESITSLSVVSSAAGGGARTLNILALGMANLIGGLFILCHNIWELRSDNIEEVSNQVSDIQVPQRRDRYREILGRRENFILHFAVSLISYIVFGLVPPVAYGFSFRRSDDTELKLLVVAASSLLCICALAIGRAYVQRPPKPYIKSVTTFVILGFFVSGVSYAAGVLVERLLEKLGVFNDSGSVADLLVPEMAGTSKTWASY